MIINHYRFLVLQQLLFVYHHFVGVQCPAGQHYATCGNSCQRTCQDIATINACKSKCVEGCYCPKGLTLSESGGECIPVVECPCHNNGQKYKSGQKRIEAGAEGPQLCTCKSATWECRSAEKTEIALWKDSSENSCSRRKHLTFTECEPSEPVTCRVRSYNMFYFISNPTSQRCVELVVFDAFLNNGMMQTAISSVFFVRVTPIKQHYGVLFIFQISVRRMNY